MKKKKSDPVVKPGACTTLDHVYPKSKFGQRCYCGARVWGSKAQKDDQKTVAPPMEDAVQINGDGWDNRIGSGARAQPPTTPATNQENRPCQ